MFLISTFVSYRAPRHHRLGPMLTIESLMPGKFRIPRCQENEQLFVLKNPTLVASERCNSSTFPVAVRRPCHGFENWNLAVRNVKAQMERLHARKSAGSRVGQRNIETPLLCKRLAIDCRGMICQWCQWGQAGSTLEANWKIAICRIWGVYPQLLCQSQAGWGERAPLSLGAACEICEHPPLERISTPYGI